MVYVHIPLYFLNQIKIASAQSSAQYWIISGSWIEFQWEQKYSCQNISLKHNIITSCQKSKVVWWNILFLQITYWYCFQKKLSKISIFSGNIGSSKKYCHCQNIWLKGAITALWQMSRPGFRTRLGEMSSQLKNPISVLFSPIFYQDPFLSGKYHLNFFSLFLNIF